MLLLLRTNTSAILQIHVLLCIYKTRILESDLISQVAKYEYEGFPCKKVIQGLAGASYLQKG